MLFSSISFIFLFLPVFLLVYYITPVRYRNIPLFIGSLLFYALGELKYFPLLIVTVLLNYAVSGLIWENRGSSRKLFLWGIVIYNFSLLLGFKYFSDMIPLGISFYIFQVTAYVADVYRRKTPPARNLLEMGVFVCLFPQLIAGPIILYSDISEQIRKRRYCMADLENGLKLFVLGLSSKILIADVMGKLWNEIQVTGFESISTPMAWLGAAAFSMEIFFDFNGYSLMAVGLGKMFGFSIPRNFDKPYLSLSVSEFWRRWHITLGSWFREYVYIPLGGSRGGNLKTVRNLFIVWIFTAMWHGRGWNFILWGMSVFVLVVIEKAGFGKFLASHRIIARVYMLLYIPLSWIVFAVEDIREIGIYFSRLFPFLQGESPVYVNPGDVTSAVMRYGVFLLAALVLCMRFPSGIYEKKKDRMWISGLLAILFVLSVVSMIRNASNPFLYFRF
ncbi:MAG: MBOAT family protein [Clostridiales bacterium]|nr:MBOAT family protein [Clostridiales bacterium]